ncbi:MAG TPA: trimeric intracellular cation channel family protein [Saprospiraceae bacterium]|nr:trimeric intracellular cation channel family protein [Saprospiraceae bacterium]
MTYLYLIDLMGTLVFAISGVLVAVEKQFDWVGAAVIGFVTAVGGGTLRDMMIGRTPVGWMQDTNYLIVILASLPLIFYFRKYILRLRKSLFLFDTIGIGLFTILGLEKTLEAGLSPLVALLMGMVSAVFGGVTRDVLTNEIPLIFRKEIYASACIAGGTVFLVLEQFSPIYVLNLWLSIAVVILIRTLSVIKHWSMPFNPKN